MQIVFLEMKCQSLFTKCTWKNEINILMLSAEFSTQHAKHKGILLCQVMWVIPTETVSSDIC